MHHHNCIMNLILMGYSLFKEKGVAVYGTYIREFKYYEYFYTTHIQTLSGTTTT